MHLVQELLTNIQCNGVWNGSRHFAKETKALKMRIRVAGSEVDNDQLRVIIKVDPPKNSKVIILWSFGIWSKLERWKSLKSGALWSDRKSKISLFWSVVFSHTMQQQTISWSYWDKQQKVDFIQLRLTSSAAGRRRSSKALPKAKLAPKKRSWTLVICCQSDPLQLSESW